MVNGSKCLSKVFSHEKLVLIRGKNENCRHTQENIFALPSSVISRVLCPQVWYPTFLSFLSDKKAKHDLLKYERSNVGLKKLCEIGEEICIPVCLSFLFLLCFYLACNDFY